MGEHLTEYVQLTRDVAYYLEHMEVLFSQEARHRSVPTLFVFQFMLLMISVGVYICLCKSHYLFSVFVSFLEGI